MSDNEALACEFCGRSGVEFRTTQGWAICGVCWNAPNLLEHAIENLRALRDALESQSRDSLRLDWMPQDVAEACARVCESRARSLRDDSSNTFAALEADKCAAAVRYAWPKYMPKSNDVPSSPLSGTLDKDRRSDQ